MNKISEWMNEHMHERNSNYIVVFYLWEDLLVAWVASRNKGTLYWLIWVLTCIYVPLVEIANSWNFTFFIPQRNTVQWNLILWILFLKSQVSLSRVKKDNFKRHKSKILAIGRKYIACSKSCWLRSCLILVWKMSFLVSTGARTPPRGQRGIATWREGGSHVRISRSSSFLRNSLFT